MSEGLNLDTFSLKTHFGRPNLIILQVACADFGHARKFVVSRARDNVYSSLGASDPFFVLIKLPPPVFNEPLLFISVDPGEVAGFGICGGNSADIGGYQRGGNGCSEWVSKGGFP